MSVGVTVITSSLFTLFRCEFFLDFDICQELIGKRFEDINRGTISLRPNDARLDKTTWRDCEKCCVMFGFMPSMVIVLFLYLSW